MHYSNGIEIDELVFKTGFSTNHASMLVLWQNHSNLVEVNNTTGMVANLDLIFS